MADLAGLVAAMGVLAGLIAVSTRADPALALGNRADLRGWFLLLLEHSSGGEPVARMARCAAASV